MNDDLIVNNVLSASTHIFGRTLNSARIHHFIIDGTNEPTEELTPVEVFLSSVSSCAVQQVERFAREEGIGLDRVEASIEGIRTHEDPSVFQSVSLRVDVFGPSQKDAEALVTRFRGRCPLFRTLSKAVDVDVEVLSHPSETQSAPTGGVTA
jgi:uncharacterized OsmC-like protein